MMVVVMPAQAQVDVAVDGDQVPGGTVTATVTTTDGSTIKSVSWSQTGGAEAALSGTDSETVTAVLADAAAYKAALIHALSEPPIGPDQLPPNIEFPDGEFPGGLQNRFTVVGINPLALEHGSAIELEAEVSTSSGDYTVHAEIVVDLGYGWTYGVKNVPINVVVLLQGKEQSAYDWVLTAPSGSAAALADADTQNPEFTPDVAGRYEITVTDEATSEEVTIVMYAGTYVGAITGQDEDGNPEADGCTGCHDAVTPGLFSDWAKSGHAEILQQNFAVPAANSHYGDRCFACHSVGYNPAADNGGFDEADGYDAWYDTYFPDGHPATDENSWTETLANFPAVAQLANIQCENCHGPNDGGAHTRGGAIRATLSADMCAFCHGEPPRHGRFQQWQISPHANYELAIEEGQSGTCSKCHTANGFLAWLPVLTGEVGGDPNDGVEVTWTPDQTHPQTCQTCHDPHAQGDASGDEGNATVRISGDTPELLAGFTATDVGSGAMCMTCHNTRRGLRNDENWPPSDPDRAPHSGAQTDVLMGQNAYFVDIGDPGFHARLDDTCTDCHMKATPPPDELSYYGGGLNHTFYAEKGICADCHQTIDAEDVQGPTEEKMDELKALIEDDLMDIFAAEFAKGNTIDFGGDFTLASMADIEEFEFTETHGRQAIAVTPTGGESVAHGYGDIEAVPPSGEPVDFRDLVNDVTYKAGWNYILFHSDGSHGVHNPRFADAVLKASITAVETGVEGPGGATGGIAAVSCETPYFYWAEIATHAPGLAGSLWRTDLAAKNNGSVAANVEFILHADSGDYSTASVIDPMAQGAFEDIVGAMGVTNDKGTLEICSDQPLQIVTRVFNQSDEGTFGQFIDAVNTGGLETGSAARLLGLRQQTGAFRTNIQVANASPDDAEVAVTLYASDGTEVGSFTMFVAAGMVAQEVEPFVNYASQPDLGWGFAMVEVTAGEGILTSASVIDMQTNDGTTIPAKK
jgi:hypothetical protein